MELNALLSDWFGDSFRLIWPWMLLLLPLPWLIGKKGQEKHSNNVAAPQLPFLYDTAQSLGLSASDSANTPPRWHAWIKVLSWIALVLAACRPQYVGDAIELPLSGRDLMLAVDISPSMKEKDMILKGFKSTRLEVVKSVVSDFVKARKGDRVGLILFGTQPYIQAPLSFDTVTVNTLLQEAYLGMAGQATAIGDAIALGVKRLRDRPDQSRVLILLTDGANTAGEIPPEKAAQLAAKEKIKIYTIGIGAEEMLKQSFFGTRRVNPSADLDEAMLQKIADLTDGKFFRARNTAELQLIYEGINQLEPVEQESRSFRPTKALFYWPLGIALCFYLLLLLIQLSRALKGLVVNEADYSKQQQNHRGGPVQ